MTDFATINIVRTLTPAPAGWTVHYTVPAGSTGHAAICTAAVAGWALRPLPGRTGEYPAAVWSREDGTLAFAEEHPGAITVTGPGETLTDEQRNDLRDRGQSDASKAAA